MSKNLEGKTALITGASKGVGEAIAELLGSYKMKIGLMARSTEKLDNVAKKIQQAGGQALVLTTDLKNQHEIENALAKIKQEYGFVDILINSAGIGHRGFWNDLSLETDLETFSVNYHAPVILIRHLLPKMLTDNKGQIINVNSIAGLYSAPYQGSYAASKCALVAYVESLAFELENTKVKMSTIFPGPIDTEFLNGKNFTSFKKSPDMVSAKYIAKKIFSLIEKPKERLFIGSPAKLLATKIAFFHPRLFRKIIENKNPPPEHI
jgi:short-subunit dehydrogenase